MAQPEPPESPDSEPPQADPGSSPSARGRAGSPRRARSIGTVIGVALSVVLVTCGLVVVGLTVLVGTAMGHWGTNK